jgi:hypothetical protein
MAKTAAFHSVPLNSSVYHDNDACDDGKKLKNKVQGTGGKPRCKDCAKLDK